MKTQLFKYLLVVSVSIVLFSACGSEEEVVYAVINKSVSLNVKETVALTLIPINAGWVFSSEDSAIATVSPLGIIEGKHMGKAIITVRDTVTGFNSQVNVTVTTINSLFREPCLTFNVNEYTVRKYERRTLLSTSRQTDGSFYMRYQSDNSYHDNVVYFFDKNKKYYESEVVVFDFYKETLDAYLSDRCIALPNPNQSRFVPFIVPDSSVRVYADNSLERTMVLYTDGNYSGNLTWVFWYAN